MEQFFLENIYFVQKIIAFTCNNTIILEMSAFLPILAICLYLVYNCTENTDNEKTLLLDVN